MGTYDGPKISGRVSGLRVLRNGWFDNTGMSELEGQDLWSERVQVRWRF